MAAADLTGTGGALGEVVLEFAVTDGSTVWEFRSAWTGVSDLIVEGVVLETAPEEPAGP